MERPEAQSWESFRPPASPDADPLLPATEVLAVKTILQRQVELATAHGPRWVSNPRALLTGAAAFAAVVLGPQALGVCGCTTLALGSFIMILATALLVGNSAITALAEEREKKTLVFLRLTMLSAPQVMLLKMVPEFLVLRSVLLVTAPVVLLAGLLDGSLTQALYQVALAGATGVFAAGAGIYLSTMFQNKSKAVVGGWIFKAVWLLLTPLFDTVVAAVTVQTTTPPVFMNLNPMAAWWFSAAPEAASGAQHWLTFLALPAMLLVSLGLVLVAARRFDAGLIVGNIVGDEQIHSVYETGWGPQWLQSRFPVFRKNPLFLRELAVQMRGGAGRWPGYAVFAVLFLAPFMYARMWAIKDADMPQPTNVPHVSVNAYNNEAPADGQPAISMHTQDGVQLVLLGHKPCLCFRLILNQAFDVPLPAGQVREVHVAYTAGYGSRPQLTYTDPQTGSVGAAVTAPQPIDPGTLESIDRSSLSWGFTGAVFMLLVYVGIRCSGFLATAVTGERDRRSWEDLALTILKPGEAMTGKTLGSLLLPLVQMTATFPLLLFFVFSGNLSVVEVGFLYSYVVALAVAAGLLGLWASSISATSHEAHARALGLGFVIFVVAPALLPMAVLVGLGALLMGGALTAMRNRLGEAMGWFGLSAALLLCPSAVSPMTAVLSFMPSLNLAGMHAVGDGANPYAAFVCAMLAIVSFSSLLWHGVINRLHEPEQEDTLRTQFAV